MPKAKASTMLARGPRIFEDLQDPGPIPESGDNAFKIAIRKLDSYFRVEENIPYERHVFR